MSDLKKILETFRLNCDTWGYKQAVKTAEANLSAHLLQTLLELPAMQMEEEILTNHIEVRNRNFARQQIIKEARAKYE